MLPGVPIKSFNGNGAGSGLVCDTSVLVKVVARAPVGVRFSQLIGCQNLIFNCARWFVLYQVLHHALLLA
jgi:hypothetical protein